MVAVHNSTFGYAICFIGDDGVSLHRIDLGSLKFLILIIKTDAVSRMQGDSGGEGDAISPDVGNKADTFSGHLGGLRRTDGSIAIMQKVVGVATIEGLVQIRGEIKR